MNRKDLGVVDHQNEVFDYPGLCMDSSSIPTSLGVNPSLDDLRGRRAGMPGLDRAKHGVRLAREARTLHAGRAFDLVGPRQPVRRKSDKAIDEKVRSYETAFR